MLKNNTFLKILSLLIAILLWLYVMGLVNPTTSYTIRNVPVQLLHQDTLAQRGLAVGDTAGYEISITVAGPKSDITKLNKGRIKATADIFGYEKGENSVPVKVDVPDGIRLTGTDPPAIQVDLEEYAFVYKSIGVTFTGETPRGTEPGRLSVNPAQIEVKGAKSLVDAVDAVNAQINASGLTPEPQTFHVTPAAVDKNGKTVAGVLLSAETVEIQAVLYHTKTVPLKVDIKGKVPAAYKLTGLLVPKEITIRGPESAVAAITRITAQPIDLSHITANTVIPVRPNLPRQVETANKSKNLSVVIDIK